MNVAVSTLVVGTCVAACCVSMAMAYEFFGHDAKRETVIFFASYNRCGRMLPPTYFFLLEHEVDGCGRQCCFVATCDVFAETGATTGGQTRRQ